MQNHQLIELYERLFSQLNLLESPADVFREALTYAKIEGLKAIDAIHLTDVTQFLNNYCTIVS